MEKPTQQTDNQLLAYLDRVCARLDQVCDTGFVEDPEEMDAQLDLDVAAIEGSVESLMADLGLEEPKTVDLNSIVDAVSREFLLANEVPLTIKTTKTPQLPELPHPPQLMLAVVLRALRIIADYVPEGAELSMSTARSSGFAIVQIAAQFTTPPAALPVQVRTLSLAELVEDLGGDVLVEQGEDTVQLFLAFPV